MVLMYVASGFKGTSGFNGTSDFNGTAGLKVFE